VGDARKATRRNFEKRWIVMGLPIALTIAGSDSSGGAGIQADLKTFAAFGVYGASAITALTAQNTHGVQAVSAVTAAFVVAQMDSVLSDLSVRAMKTGMLADRAIVEAVSARLSHSPNVPLVVDPVMVATSGDALLAPDAVGAVVRNLMPRATLITPNIAEAARLLGTAPATTEASMAIQARALVRLGARAVLLKGGHSGDAQATDVFTDGVSDHLFSAPRIVTPHTHGTGCTLSAAITAGLAAGMPLLEAIGAAKLFVSRALVAGLTLSVGSGSGPLDHTVNCAVGGRLLTQ
jgi:hydroxymethylpyrimidine/phosphomethylpyrimidine kinase